MENRKNKGYCGYDCSTCAGMILLCLDKQNEKDKFLKKIQM